MQLLFVVLIYSVLFILFCNVIVGIVQWKNLSGALKIFVLYLGWNFLIEVAAKLDLHYQLLGGNNLPLLHIYTLGEFILLFLFYVKLIERPQWLHDNRQLLLWSISGLIILNSIFIQNIFEFNTYAKTLVQLILIGCAILYFFNQAGKEQEPNPEARGLRIINSAILIYYSSSLVIFMFGNFLLTVETNEFYLWIVNASLNILFHLLIFIALWSLLSRKVRFF